MGCFDENSQLMEHFLHPRNVGKMENPDGVGHIGNPMCGDIMDLYIKVENDKIVDAKFQTYGCLPPSEKVVLSNNDWQLIKAIKTQDKVLNSDGKEINVIETYQRRYRGDLLKIIPFISTFNSFFLTPEHPVLSIKRSWLERTRKSSSQCDWLRINKAELLDIEPEYVRAKNLEKGDYLVFVVNKKIKDIPEFNTDVMKLVGLYLAEGYRAAKGRMVAFAFNKKEKDLIEEIKSILYRLIKKYPGQRTRDNVTEIYIASTKLVRFLEKLAGHGAKNKKLSEEVMSLPLKKQWQMFLYYLRGDGNEYKRRPQDSSTFRADTVSKNLVIQLQQILARGGIFSSIKVSHSSPSFIGGRKIKSGIRYDISFKLKRKHKFFHSTSKYILVPIREIKIQKYNGRVYNFQVAQEPNSYLVRGFAVHNCAAAIASTSVLTELIKGKAIAEAEEISHKKIQEVLGQVPAHKYHCTILAEQALKSAIEDYKEKRKV